MADEALNAFTTLLDHIPGWISDLESVVRTSTERQQEMLAAEQSAQCWTRLSSTSSSLNSRWSKKSVTHSPADKPTIPDPSMLQPQPPHLISSDALRSTQRKRKTMSVSSGKPSGPSPHCHRGLTVTYYDTDVQRRFETLVRSIGISRNAIRKGKMGAKVDALSRTGSSSSEGDRCSGGEDATLDFGKLNYKSSRPSGRPLFGKMDETETFDRVDGFLEKGQSACERAAHQVLRVGDCSGELSVARQSFQDALRLATNEVPALTMKAERATIRRRRSVERHQVEEVENPRPTIATIEVLDARSTLLLRLDAKLEVDLEVDDGLEIDDDDDDDDFSLPILPPTRLKYRMQTSRLYAH